MSFCREIELTLPQDKIINLNCLSPGEKALVTNIPEHPLLHALGLRPGKVVESLGCQLFGGPLMIKAGDRRVAIGKRIADEITVIYV